MFCFLIVIAVSAFVQDEDRILNSLIEAAAETLRQNQHSELHVMPEDPLTSEERLSLWKHFIPFEEVSEKHWWPMLENGLKEKDAIGQDPQYSSYFQHLLLGSLQWNIAQLQRKSIWLVAIKSLSNRTIADNESKTCFKDLITFLDTTLDFLPEGMQIVFLVPDFCALQKKLIYDMVDLEGSEKIGIFEYNGKQAHLSETTGYVSEMMKALEKSLNYTSFIWFSFEFGSKLENGSFFGMIDDIAKGADMSLMDFSTADDRTEVADFIVYGEDNSVLLAKVPSEVVNPFLLLKIFSPMIWTSMILSVLTVGFLTYIFIRIEYSIGRIDHLISFQESMLLSWSAMVYQGYKNWPNKSASNGLGAVLFIISVVLYALYAGYITSFLAIPFRDTPIETTEDIVKHGISATMKVGANIKTYIESSESEVLKALRKNMKAFPSAHINTRTFLNEVAEGKYVNIDTLSSMLGFIIKAEKPGSECRLRISNTPFYLNYDSMAIAKNSPFKRPFEKKLFQLKCFGILSYLKQKNLYITCFHTYRKSLHPLKVWQVQGALYILLAGLFISLLAFLFETVVATVSSKINV